MTVEWKDLLNSKGEFDIPPEKWSALNESMTKAEIIGLLNDYIATMPGAQYQGAIGMKMAVRPNPGTDTFCEPIWVWRKG